LIHFDFQAHRAKGDNVLLTQYSSCSVYYSWTDC